MDRMLVNAAIERLINKNASGEDAMVVIKFCENFPVKKGLAIQYTSDSTDQSNVTGATEHGDIKIESSEKKHTEFDFGIKKERVGYYKVWKEKKNVLAIQYYWKSDTSTESESGPPPEYRLAYNKDLSPRFFAQIVFKPWATFRSGSQVTSIGYDKLEVFYGEALILFQNIRVSSLPG